MTVGPAAAALVAGLLALSGICPCLGVGEAEQQPAAHDCGGEPTHPNGGPQDECGMSCLRDSAVKARKAAHHPASQDGVELALAENPSVAFAPLPEARQARSILPPQPARPVYILLSVLNL